MVAGAGNAGAAARGRFHAIRSMSEELVVEELVDLSALEKKQRSQLGKRWLLAAQTDLDPDPRGFTADT